MPHRTLLGVLDKALNLHGQAPEVAKVGRRAERRSGHRREDPVAHPRRDRRPIARAVFGGDLMRPTTTLPPERKRKKGRSRSLSTTAAHRTYCLATRGGRERVGADRDFMARAFSVRAGGLAATAVYRCLAYHCSKSERRIAYPAQGTVAEYCEITVRHVRRVQ